MTAVTIVGGGIGGMTLALSLAAAGIDDVDVYESSGSIRELGVGINIQPHAIRELTELGLLDVLYEVGVPTAEVLYLSKHGKLVWTEPRGLNAGYLWPQFSIHRGQLLGVLHRAVVQRLGDERVHVGRHLVRCGQDGDRTWAEFAERAGGESVERVEADLLIGCDGIHSVVRASFYPNEGPPHWTGITMWRGVTEAEPFLTGRSMVVSGYNGLRLVVYPISKQHADRGRALINWVAELRTGDDRPMPRQDWNHEADRDEALCAFASFRFDPVDGPSLIAGAEAMYQYPMVDRDPLPSWDFGRITLLGDAAHPMQPNGSNGASQSILDARVLAREVALQPSVQGAVHAYDATRRPATSAVVMASRGFGPERCLEVVEERAPNGFDNLDDVVSHQELAQIAIDFKRAAGMDPAILNERPSLSAR